MPFKHALPSLFLILFFFPLQTWGQNSNFLHAARIFSDNMVIQQGIHAPVWGTASGGEKISIEFAGQTVKCVASPDGRWQAKLPVLKKSGPFELVIKATQVIKFKNVMVGEVWLASGQSNMEFPMYRSDRSVLNAETEIPNAKYPQIREFHVNKSVSPIPLSDLKQGEWKVCDPENVKSFSAVAFYFARKLALDQNVTVGIIQTSYGGTKAEAWTSPEMLINNPEYTARVKQLKTHPEPWEKRKYGADSLFKLRDSIAGNGLSILYNAMINPIVPYGIKGVIWYQGESNEAKPASYENLLSSLIKDWRTKWSHKDLPFIFVQLPNYGPGVNWVKLREAQQKVLSVDKTGMAVTLDVGNPNDIHPVNKKPVGERLYAAAKKVAYGSESSFEGPHYHKFKKSTKSIQVSIEDAGTGLKSIGQKSPEGFEIAGDDKIFYPAEVTIKGKEINISSSKVAKPVAVRYGWKPNPSVNTYNSDDLPLAPFRTDNWK